MNFSISKYYTPEPVWELMDDRKLELDKKYKPDFWLDLSRFYEEGLFPTPTHGFSEKHIGQTYTFLAADESYVAAYNLKIYIQRVPNKQDFDAIIKGQLYTTFDKSSGKWNDLDLSPEIKNQYVKFRADSEFGTNYPPELANYMPYEEQKLAGASMDRHHRLHRLLYCLPVKNLIEAI